MCLPLMNFELGLSKDWASMLGRVALQFTRQELVKDVLTQRRTEVLPFFLSYCRERFGPSAIEDSITVIRCKMRSDDDEKHGTVLLSVVEAPGEAPCLAGTFFTLDLSNQVLRLSVESPW